MRIFGLWITTEKTYQEYRTLLTKQMKLRDVAVWFGGWDDLKIIFNYVMSDFNIGGISRAREDYSKARKTNEYGETK